MHVNAHSDKVYLIIFGCVKQIVKEYLLCAEGVKLLMLREFTV